MKYQNRAVKWWVLSLPHRTADIEGVLVHLRHVVHVSQEREAPVLSRGGGGPRLQGDLTPAELSPNLTSTF